MNSVDEYLTRNADKHTVDQGHAWLNDLMPMVGRAACPCRRCGLDYAENYDIDGECPGVRPAYRKAAFAVYPIENQFHVMRLGGGGQPFRTTDVDLAREICDRWASDPGIAEH